MNEKPNTIMFEHLIQKYQEQLVLPKEEVEMKNIIDQYMTFFNVYNEQTKVVEGKRLRVLFKEIGIPVMTLYDRKEWILKLIKEKLMK